MPHRLNPEKLRLSKWTAAAPVERERHFVVTELVRDAEERVTHCVLQAVLTRREQTLPWRALQDTGVWQQGWR